MNISSFWPELEDQLSLFRDISASIKIHLLVYEEECIKLFQKLGSVSFEESSEIFDRLEIIQGELLRAKEVYGFNLNENLNDFVYTFDRIFDMHVREAYYNKLHKQYEWPLKF